MSVCFVPHIFSLHKFLQANGNYDFSLIKGSQKTLISCHTIFIVLITNGLTAKHCLLHPVKISAEAFTRGADSQVTESPCLVYLNVDWSGGRVILDSG